MPDVVGPVRSARIGDLDLLSAMNRPVCAYSGANPGVTDWIAAAARSGVLVDFTALRNPCYVRTEDRPGPHNLLLDPNCAVSTSTAAGPARPLWHIDSTWTAPNDADGIPDTTFSPTLDGVAVDGTWARTTGTILAAPARWPPLAVAGPPTVARTGRGQAVEVSRQSARELRKALGLRKAGDDEGDVK